MVLNTIVVLQRSSQSRREWNSAAGTLRSHDELTMLGTHYSPLEAQVMPALSRASLRTMHPSTRPLMQSRG
jgi:hypothetical protein